jgi:menaquinone-dependent protoporphyrinogen oxidase
MTVHGAVMVLAGLCFAIAVLRAGILPRWAAIALAAGVVLVALTQALPESAQVLAAGIRALGFVGMGAALVVRRSPRVGSGASPDVPARASWERPPMSSPHDDLTASAPNMVAVAYASKYGSTREIAERIAEVLGESGLDAHAVAAAEVGDVASYRAVVLGSGVYMGRWLPDAWKFVRRHRAGLSTMPLWLFSSGPVGAGARHPDETALPRRVGRATERLSAREHRTFGGRVAPEPKGFMDRAVTRKIPAGRGDARDWDAIEAWAQGIAWQLQRAGDRPLVAAGGVRVAPQR